MAEVLTVLTSKSASHMIADGGSQSWKIGRRRAARCAYVVCVRHQQGPYKAEGNEPHKHAFLVGRVSGVVPASDSPDRLRVEFSEYALVNGPLIPLYSSSPTQYFPSLASIGIDEHALQWRAMDEMPDDTTANDAPKDGGDGDSISTISVFTQAKKLIADSLHVPLSAVEITVRS